MQEQHTSAEAHTVQEQAAHNRYTEEYTSHYYIQAAVEHKLAERKSAEYIQAEHKSAAVPEECMPEAVPQVEQELQAVVQQAFPDV